MNPDTVSQLAGIPNTGIRMTILVGAFFVIAILMTLIYLKMREVDEGNQGDERK